MRLQTFRYHCGACGQWFESPAIGGFAYGEFLLRSESGEMRHLNANLDPTFDEVDRLIRNDPRAAKLDKFRRADVLNYVFGITCDKDSLGNEFRIGLEARCLRCDERDIIEWESVEPPKYIDLEVPAVTHEAWSTLQETEKQSLISSALTSTAMLWR
jgi:hypothetical protein